MLSGHILSSAFTTGLLTSAECVCERVCVYLLLLEVWDQSGFKNDLQFLLLGCSMVVDLMVVLICCTDFLYLLILVYTLVYFIKVKEVVQT